MAVRPRICTPVSWSHSPRWLARLMWRFVHVNRSGLHCCRPYTECPQRILLRYGTLFASVLRRSFEQLAVRERREASAAGCRLFGAALRSRRGWATGGPDLLRDGLVRWLHCPWSLRCGRSPQRLAERPTHTPYTLVAVLVGGQHFCLALFIFCFVTFFAVSLRLLPLAGLAKAHRAVDDGG